VTLLSSPIIGEILGAEGGDLGMGEMTPEDVQMLGMLLTPMLGETAISYEAGVGLSDGYLHTVSVAMVLDLDLSLLAPEVGAISGDLSFDLTLDNINQPYSITPPDTYEPFENLDLNLGELELAF